ncbi:MAG: DUF4384 domain-containing protein [Paracoccaceae bacterium]
MSSARGAITWGAGIGISLLAHAAIAGFVLIAVKPEPLDNQPQMHGKLRVQSEVVERQDATAEQPDAEAAEAQDASGAAATAGAVPTSHAEAASLPSQPVRARPQAGGAPVPALSAQGPRLAEAPPNAQAASAASAPVTELSATLALAEQTLTAATPPAAQAAQAAMPEAVSAAAPPGQMLIAGAPRLAPTAASAVVAEASATLAPQGEVAAQAMPEVTTISAATGWAGAGDIDPVSLAAVESFMRPLDTADEAGSPRDEMAELLASAPCARLSATFVPETGTLELRGHVPDAAAANPILAALRAKLGDSIPVEGNVIVLPSPQCGLLDAVEDLGLPQSRLQQRDPMQLGAATQLTTFEYGEGERVIIRMRAYDFPAYVYVDFFDAKGNVLHLRPNQWEALVQYQPGDLIAVGDDRDDGTGVELIVRPPFGLELVVAYASSVPLYEGLREPVEPAETYLEWLRTRIAEVRAETPDYKGDWVYMFMQTHE